MEDTTKLTTACDGSDGSQRCFEGKLEIQKREGTGLPMLETAKKTKRGHMCCLFEGFPRMVVWIGGAGRGDGGGGFRFTLKTQGFSATGSSLSHGP